MLFKKNVRVLKVMAFLLLLSPRILAQEAKSFEINGHLEGLKGGKPVFLTEVLYGSWVFGKRDTCIVKDGNFHFKGQTRGGPCSYFLDLVDKGLSAQTALLVINNGEKITISCDSSIDKIDHSYIQSFLKIEGSPSNFAFERLKTGTIQYTQTIGWFRSEIRHMKDSIGFDPHLTELFVRQKEHASFIFWYTIFAHFYDDVLYQPIIPLVIAGQKIPEWSDHTPYIMDIYNSLTEPVKNSYWGKYLKDYALLSVGQPMPEFTFPDTAGKQVALKDVVARSKVTLVNFWGSNSPLTQRYHDELRIMYTKYHDKGLNILAVSSDDYVQQWKEFLGKAKYPWINVLDKKGRVVDTVYHEFTQNGEKLRNVTNVLIDSKGKIIAWDPAGPELQLYLWKAFGE